MNIDLLLIRAKDEGVDDATIFSVRGTVQDSPGAHVPPYTFPPETQRLR